MKIRPAQMQALEQEALTRFKADLLVHLRQFAPELHAVRGDECFRQVIADGTARALRYGFTNRGPIRFVLESMISYGSEFDTDPQLRGVVELLAASGKPDQMTHADRVFELIEQYQMETRGKNNEHAIRALQRLSELTDAGDRFTVGGLESDLLVFLRQIYPEKFEFVGAPILRGLIQRAALDAHEFGISSPNGIALLGALMFALGHGITRDPLYPWVRSTLTSGPEQDQRARVNRLRKKSETYLTATLANLTGV